MFKKLLIASAVLAVSSSVFAHHYANYKGDYKAEAPCPSYVYTTGPYIGVSVGPRVVGTGRPVYAKSIDGTLFAGWGGIFAQSFYLAGEIFGQGDANIKDFKGAPAKVSGAKTSWGWGLSLIPGMLITDHVLGYLRGGYVQTRFTDPNQNVNASGWQVGGGAQTNLWANWDLRGEYVYSQYNNVKRIGKPLSDQFNLGVIYKFV